MAACAFADQSSIIGVQSALNPRAASPLDSDYCPLITNCSDEEANCRRRSILADAEPAFHQLLEPAQIALQTLFHLLAIFPARLAIVAHFQSHFCFATP